MREGTYSDFRVRPKTFKKGSCFFPCNVPCQCITHRQVGPDYCDGVGCHALCLRHGIPVWQHNCQSITATSRHRRDTTSKFNLKNNVKPLQSNVLSLVRSKKWPSIY